MIAVLAAMLFIGIVTASMLKNTSSQSAASRSYSGMQVMSSTVKSGMIATETYFGKENNTDAPELIAKWLNADDNGKKTQFVLFDKNSGNGKKTRLGNSDQYFSSRIDNIEKKTNSTAYVRFEIQSGRRENGKGLKKAMAFYIGEGVAITNTLKYKADNAVYMKGSLADGNDGMEVHGSVTFEGKVTFQIKQSIFHKDAYFDKGVIINTDKVPAFKDKAYFNDYLDCDFNASSPIQIFDSAVGINGNFSALNKTIKFGSDLWFNGDFITPYGSRDDRRQENNYILQGNKKTNNIYYSKNIPMSSSNMGCNDCKTIPNATCRVKAGCCPHDCEHPVDKSKLIGDDFANRDVASAYAQTNSNGIIDNIPQKMGMTTLEQRRDDELSIDNIPLDKRYSISQVKSAGCNDFSVTCIEKKWTEAKDAGNLYNDHLVVKVSASDNISEYFNKTTTGTLNKKIILILDDGAVLGGKYFKTGKESSSLIYVGKNAQLDQFSINGAFHGLIYIDADNNPPYVGAKNTINSGENDTLYGAFHSFANGNFRWNKGNGESPSVIVHDPKVLENYSTMVKCKPNKPCESSKLVAEYADSLNKRIILRPLGYYFF